MEVYTKPTKEELDFYADVFKNLSEAKIPFLIGGTYAVRKYTGIERETGDMDIFCKAGDYPRILKIMKNSGYDIDVTDERWLAKCIYKNYFVDFIIGSTNGLFPVDDTWFKRSHTAQLLGVRVHLIPPEELIWSKIFRMGRHKYDGADVNHIILKKGKLLDWKKLLTRMEPYWEIFFSQLLLFRYVYPSERDIIPEWLMKELVSRINDQMDIPAPREKICRGELLSPDQYQIDIKKWGFLTITNMVTHK